MSESILFSVAQLGNFPAARSLGRQGRDRLEEELAGKRRVDLTIDFAGVNAMTFSFTDEFLGKFLSTLDAVDGEVTVKVTGLNIENSEVVAVCVERRETPVAVLDTAGRITLLGDPILIETFETSLALGEFRANDVAKALSITSQNANNRLKRLAACGAVRRTRTTGGTRGGKEFIYIAVPTAVPDLSELATA